MMHALFSPKRLLMLGLLAVASAPAWALQPYTANYKASALGMVGDGQITLARQGDDRWEYSLTVKNSLVELSQKTVFDEKAGQYRPLSSSDVSRMVVRRKAVNTNYDWDTKQATWSGDVKPDRAGPVALKAGDMDAILLNLAVIRDVAAGKPLTYRMVENGGVRQISYKNAGKEKITVAGKTREATKVVRSSGNGKREMIVWVVPDMPVPARILQRENGQDSVDLTVTSWQ